MPTRPSDSWLFGQDQIEALCAWRPVDWSEHAPMNEFHGNASILKRYTGWPSGQPLPCVLEHAVPYDLEKAYDYDAQAGLPLFLAANETSASVYRNAGLDARPIGFSALYALRMFQETHEPWPESARRGTLVFPDKSTLLMDTDFPREAFAQKLRALPEPFQPVTVCAYWKDVVRGTHRPFLEAGLPVVTCGHLQDPLFIDRLIDLCRRHRYACANDIAGSFALSVMAGCHFFHLPGGPLTTFKHGLRQEHAQDPGLSKPDKAACLAASPYPPTDPARQRELAATLTGAHHLRPREELSGWLHEAQARLAQNLRPAVYTFGPQSTPALRASFSMAGVDSCGWCRKHSGFTIPAHAEASQVQIRCWLGREAPDEGLTLEVKVNGLLQRLFRLKRSRRIRLDLPQGDVRLEFSASLDYPLAGNDPRVRSWRLLEIRLLRSSRWNLWRLRHFSPNQS